MRNRVRKTTEMANFVLCFISTLQDDARQKAAALPELPRHQDRIALGINPEG